MNNNNDYIKQELKELKKGGLISDYKILKDDLNEYEFIMTTLEGRELNITLSVNRTYGLDGVNYECFEQILSKNSELYIKAFSQLMMNKLAVLERERSDSD
jgi:hypothetical protein